MTSQTTIKRALLSVSDKTGILELAQALKRLDVEILSTGGTAKLLTQNGIAVKEVSSHTGFPEIMDGRVKTLHPKIHGGILARRDLSTHQQALEENDIAPIDLVAVNLYPFEKTIADEKVLLESAIENIDIGGPAMVRASAKNYNDVTIIVDPKDYTKIIDELQTNQGTTLQTRSKLAAKAFAHTAHYDDVIASFLTSIKESEGKLSDIPARHEYPEIFNLQLHKVQDMRYGENPHQSAAFYRQQDACPSAIANAVQLQGKALSFNNIADSDAAWECVKTFDSTACVIVKHANPCGVAIGSTPLESYKKAFQTDPTSAFGGIIAFNQEVDEATAEAISKQFVEVIIAPSFTPEAISALENKKNIRLLRTQLANTPPQLDYKRVGGGLLVQTADKITINPAELKIVSKKQPTEQQLNDMLFAWRCAKFVKSNAIVFCGNGMTLGVGAGQMSRIDSAKIASIKAEKAGLSLKNSAVASDAFFPFRDGLDVVVEAGANGVIQPGGSMRDNEVIAAADEHDIVMVLTGVRHFRH